MELYFAIARGGNGGGVPRRGLMGTGDRARWAKVLEGLVWIMERVAMLCGGEYNARHTAHEEGVWCPETRCW